MVVVIGGGGGIRKQLCMCVRVGAAYICMSLVVDYI